MLIKEENKQHSLTNKTNEDADTLITTTKQQHNLKPKIQISSH